MPFAIDECPVCGAGPWGGETPEALASYLAAHAELFHPDRPVTLDDVEDALA